jgi:hypothetical protein
MKAIPDAPAKTPPRVNRDRVYTQGLLKLPRSLKLQVILIRLLRMLARTCSQSNSIYEEDCLPRKDSFDAIRHSLTKRIIVHHDGSRTPTLSD